MFPSSSRPDRWLAAAMNTNVPYFAGKAEHAGVGGCLDWLSHDSQKKEKRQIVYIEFIVALCGIALPIFSTPWDGTSYMYV